VNLYRIYNMIYKTLALVLNLIPIINSQLTN